MEGVGIALDVPGNRMFVTDFAGSVYSADLDGKNERNFLYAQGNLTGIASAQIRNTSKGDYSCPTSPFGASPLSVQELSARSGPRCSYGDGCRTGCCNRRLVKTPIGFSERPS
jgi:hypothetical protein